MSGLLMGLVYYYQFTPSQQKIMLALADHAHDDGTDVRPSIDTLAWKTDGYRRNIQKTLRSLEEMGVLVPVAYMTGGRGHPIEYEIHLEKATLREKPPVSAGMRRIWNMLKGGNITAVSADDILKGGNSHTKGGNSHTKGGNSHTKGGNSHTKGGSYNRPNHMNHIEPSENHHARTRETLDAKKIDEAEPEPEADLSPGSAPPLPTFSEFQRSYRQEHGQRPYAEIHRAYSALVLTQEVSSDDAAH